LAVAVAFHLTVCAGSLAKPVSESQQRLMYLEQFRIEDAGLSNIGAACIAVLLSWGVETAAEIEEAKIIGILGFGRNLTERPRQLARGA